MWVWPWEEELELLFEEKDRGAGKSLHQDSFFLAHPLGTCSCCFTSGKDVFFVG